MGKGAQSDCEYLRQIEEARIDLYNVLSSNKQMTPIVLRLAFHDAATYDRKNHTGGANGSIRNELNNPPNKGIEIAVKFLDPVKSRHPKVTYADLYQLAGIIAVNVAEGPVIEFIPGRADNLNQKDQGSIPNPNGDAAHLRSIFVNQMGLSDKDIVALSGAHALGRAHKDRSGFDGPFTRDPLTFDNSYYIELLKGDTPGLVKFPTDKALLTDRVFRPLVQLYAADEGAFFRDYALSHTKLSMLGYNPNINKAQAQFHQAQSYEAQICYSEPEEDCCDESDEAQYSQAQAHYPQGSQCPSQARFYYN